MEKLKYEPPIINKISAGTADKFGLTANMPIIDNIDGVAVSEIVEKYGSPVYVISEKTIRDTYKDAYRAFSTRYPKVQFAWSYKTNYLDAVCKTFHSEGSWAEVVSGFEYDKAIANGVPGNKIIFNGPSKTEAELIKASKNGSLIHIDHFDELYMLVSLAETENLKPKIAIRVNMDIGIYPRWDRFGFNYENGEAWRALSRIMMDGKLELVGLHTHIGTYMMAPWAYATAAAKLADLAVGLDIKHNHKIKYIDLGGGFASKNTLKGAYLPGKDTCPTFDDYAEAIANALFASNINPQFMPTLFLETGRALIDEAGFLVSSVIANKRLSDGRKSMVIDAGVNLLFTSFWYEHEIYPSKQTGEHKEDTTIYGPLCMNIDVIRASVNFPPLIKGDTVVIPRIGAYNMTQWMQFITLRPNIILIDIEGKTHKIRESETIKSITDFEKTPEHLK